MIIIIPYLQRKLSVRDFLWSKKTKLTHTHTHTTVISGFHFLIIFVNIILKKWAWCAKSFQNSLSDDELIRLKYCHVADTNPIDFLRSRCFKDVLICLFVWQNLSVRGAFKIFDIKQEKRSLEGTYVCWRVTHCSPWWILKCLLMAGFYIILHNAWTFLLWWREKLFLGCETLHLFFHFILFYYECMFVHTRVCVCICVYYWCRTETACHWNDAVSSHKHSWLRTPLPHRGVGEMHKSTKATAPVSFHIRRCCGPHENEIQSEVTSCFWDVQESREVEENVEAEGRRRTLCLRDGRREQCKRKMVSTVSERLASTRSRYSQPVVNWIIIASQNQTV